MDQQRHTRLEDGGKRNRQIESVFTRTGDRAEVRPMTEEESRLLMGLIIGTKDQSKAALYAPCKASQLEELMQAELCPDKESLPTVMAIFARRLAVMTPDAEYVPAVVTFLSVAADRPGVVVMFAYGLHRATEQLGVVDIDKMCKDLIPMGFPTEERMHRIWESQKGVELANGRVPDNYIDHAEAWA